MSYTSQNHKCDKIENLISVLSDLLASPIDSVNTVEQFSRLEIEIPPVNLIDWLYNQKSDKKIYWSDKNGNLEISAIGINDIIYEKEHNNLKSKFKNLVKNLKKSDKRLKYFGGFKFDSNQPISDDWKFFDYCLFILPRFEVIRRENIFYFACNFSNFNSNSKNELLDDFRELSFSLSDKTEFKNKIISRKDNPDRSGWNSYIEKAKSKISLGKIGKIILSRQTELVCEKEISPESLLKKLMTQNNSCYHFLFQINRLSTFVGASPEKLFTRMGDKIECEAIAGTVRRGKNEIEDEQLGSFLINNQKNITEHRFVIKSIVESLDKLVESKDEPEKIDVELLKLSNLQHLVSRFRYNLKINVSDYDLLDKLHPTAAVGGYPKKQALKEIAKIEMFDRGWYAAPIGWIGIESTEFVVGIRSGLVNNNRLLLYSGAGIIESSETEAEWDEIENKLGNFLSVFF